jgi:hypothetical protein
MLIDKTIQNDYFWRYYMYNFTENEIKIANLTCRSKGSSVFNKDGSIRSVVALYVLENIDRKEKILDFGCGKEFIQGKFLNEKGFDVSGYDFGSNKPENGVELFKQKYSVIYASNVLNVQSSMVMMLETLQQINNSLEPGGEFICNYPSSPRKMLLSANDLKEIIQSIFKGKIERVGGTSSAPLWVVQKRYIN